MEIWNVRVQYIPLVLGSLVAIPKQLGKRLRGIGVTTESRHPEIIFGRSIKLRKFFEI